MKVRWLVGALVFVSLVPWDVPLASASVSTPCTFTKLLHDTSLVAIAMPVEKKVVWEGGRVVTYSHVRLERVIAGSSDASDVWVATLGGVVGNVGQVVDGEPQFDVGFHSLVFLRPDATSPGTGVHRVVARAQGQFAIARDSENVSHLASMAHAVVLSAPPTTLLATDALAGATVDDAATLIAAEWRKAHAH